MSNPKIVIVGGGIAGWIAALYFEKTFYNLAKKVNIVVIESGEPPETETEEGTTSIFWDLIKFLEIDEFELIRKTKATFKYGIRYKNWKSKGEFYDEPLDSPHLVPELSELNNNQYWLYLECLAAKKPLSAIHKFTYFMEKERAPFTKIDNTIRDLTNFIFGYHFELVKLVSYFRMKRNCERTKILNCRLRGVVLKSDSKVIDHLILEDGRHVHGDLFIDCTGPQRLLISKFPRFKWIDQTYCSPVNRVMHFKQDHEENEEILPYTLAEALDNGWMWTIPTLERKGCGYVYSDNFIDPDGARKEIERYLGKSIEPDNDIKISPGILNQALIGNCLALGHSQSHFDPLGSISIHLIYQQLLMFTNYDLHKVIKGEYGGFLYNNGVFIQSIEIIDFINLHYTGDRTDSPFWEHVTNKCRTYLVNDMLKKFSNRIPTQKDFDNYLCRIPIVEGDYYPLILDGLGKLNTSHARKVLSLRPKQRKFTRQVFKHYLGKFNEVAELGQGHRSFLEELNL